MNAEVNYAGINRRVVAFFVDQIIFLVFYLFILFLLSGKLPADIFNYDDVYADSLISSRYDVLEELISTALYVALEVLMIFKLGWTPGKLLCGIYIKDAGTLKNITLMQAVIRSTLKELLFVPLYISEWFMILPVLVLILAVFDRHKQCFYDKITKTVVVLKECDTNLNYMGITRRAIAHIIDCFIIVGICLIFFFFAKTVLGFYKSQSLTKCLSFLLSIVFEIFLIKRFNGTPGQLLFCIHIKDANTLKGITIMQATVRYILFRAFSLTATICILIIKALTDEHTSEWWLLPLLGLIFIAMILIIIHAIFDKRKQLFYDKIARTVAIVSIQPGGKIKSRQGMLKR